MKKDKMQVIRERLNEALDADEDNRRDALNDLEFLSGQQWPEKIKQQREMEGKPVLTINRMPQFVRQITGDIRQSNPAIDVFPGDGEASEDMAEIIAGNIRYIEYKHDAQSIYEQAASSAASCGIGAFRVHYEQGARGNELVIRAIPNPFAVVWDPLSKDPTRKDARYCFVMEQMPRSDFEKAYPGKDPADISQGGVNESYRNWVSADTVTVAEYWRIEEGAVRSTLISANAELDKTADWPGKYIPIIAVVGEETHIGDRVHRASAIRYAKDSQQLYNFWRSTQAEVVGLQPKAPYMVTAKQIKGHQAMWNTSHLTTRPYLLYNWDEKAPPPKREMPPQPSAGTMQEVMIAADEMKATTGIYDAALGDQSNEKSGVAIRQRQIESDISTSIYIDNLSKSIAHCGRIILDLIPKLYDTTRTLQVVGVDGATSMADINVPVMSPLGPVYMNDPSFGQYDVRIKTGPSYSTQRQEAVESLMEFVRVHPPAAAIAGDLIARNMDWPGAEELADRLKTMLPPGVATDDETTPEQSQIQALQQQLQQMQQQMQAIMESPELQKAKAEAVEAEADAAKAGLEVQEKQMELAVSSGQMNAAIEQAVARALSAFLPQQGAF